MSLVVFISSIFWATFGIDSEMLERMEKGKYEQNDVNHLIVWFSVFIGSFISVVISWFLY